MRTSSGPASSFAIGTSPITTSRLSGNTTPVRIAPDGRLVDRVDLPVSQATSCTFGGDDLGDLYITTAHEDFTSADFAREPLAGGLFRCRPGVRGLEPIPFATAGGTP